jgi:hypothetical protein
MPDLQGDLAALQCLPFKRREKLEGLMRDIHARLLKPWSEAEAAALETLRRWLLTPYTLWPVDFQGLGVHVVSLLDGSRRLPDDLIFLLQQAGTPPGHKACTTVAEYERLVETGRYEQFLRTQAKLAEREQQLRHDQAFQADWERLKGLFDLKRYSNPKGIIRRSLVQERNFRPDWDFQPRRHGKVFQAVFDAFCHRWGLYGMEGGKPLPLKLSVNLTAHGTMIFIPAAWSLDCKRDVVWREIARLHRARGVRRQGPKLSPGRAEKLARQAAVGRLLREAGRRGLRGEESYGFVKRGLGLDPRTDNRTIRRLAAGATKLENCLQDGKPMA